MKAVNVFLARFKDLAPVDAVLKLAVIASVERKLRIKLNQSHITVERSAVYLKTSPIIKNQIFLYREEIIEEIANSLQEKKRTLL